MKILCFTPTGSRTGSELVLYNIIRYADRQKLRLAMASRRAGELLEHLPPDVPGLVYSYPDHRSLQTRVRDVLHYRIAGRAFNRLVYDFHQRFKPDLWYVNTIVQPEIIRQARDMGVPCAVHAHELEQVLFHLEPSEIENLIEYPKLIIACSRAVESEWRILGRTRNLEVCNEMVALEDINSDISKAGALRRTLNIPADAFVWVNSGTLDPNKNPVQFVDVANEILKRKPNTHFMWLGGSENGYSYFAKKAAAALEISGQMHWLGAQTTDYYDYLNAADGFVLVSRRDSFPLVMIEAAALGKPIVSFNSGGISEFMSEGMGTVVDSWNTSDLSTAMQNIMDGTSEFEPGKARDRAKAFDAPRLVKHWEQIIQQYFG